MSAEPLHWLNYIEGSLECFLCLLFWLSFIARPRRLPLSRCLDLEAWTRLNLESNFSFKCTVSLIQCRWCLSHAHQLYHGKFWGSVHIVVTHLCLKNLCAAYNIKLPCLSSQALKLVAQHGGDKLLIWRVISDHIRSYQIAGNPHLLYANFPLGERGSVLGPFRFSLNASSLNEVIFSHVFSYHLRHLCTCLSQHVWRVSHHGWQLII